MFPKAFYNLFYLVNFTIFCINPFLALANSPNNSIELEFLDQNKRKSDIELIAEIQPFSSLRGDLVEITLIGRIKPGKHIYSVERQGEFAPEPSKLTINYFWLKPKNKTQESIPLTILDKAFGINLKIHSHEFHFKQKFIVAKESPLGKHKLKGKLEYQICDNRICSFPKKSPFDFELEIINK